MSPTGYYGDALEWNIFKTGSVNTGHDVYYDFSLRPVINLKSDIRVSGTGTSTNPFTVE